jgi:hypothetical protein
MDKGPQILALLRLKALNDMRKEEKNTCSENKKTAWNNATASNCWPLF